MAYLHSDPNNIKQLTRVDGNIAVEGNIYAEEIVSQPQNNKERVFIYGDQEGIPNRIIKSSRAPGHENSITNTSLEEIIDSNNATYNIIDSTKVTFADDEVDVYNINSNSSKINTPTHKILAEINGNSDILYMRLFREGYDEDLSDGRYICNYKGSKYIEVLPTTDESIENGEPWPIDYESNTIFAYKYMCTINNDPSGGYSIVGYSGHTVGYNGDDIGYLN